MIESDLTKAKTRKVRHKRKARKKAGTKDEALAIICHSNKKKKKKKKGRRSAGVLTLANEADLRIQGERTYNHAKRAKKAISNGSQMAEIERYAKENKITVSQAMTLYAIGEMK